MFMRYKISKTEDGENELNVRIRFEELNMPNVIKDNTDLLRDLTITSLKINGVTVAKESDVLDFDNTKNIVALNYKNIIANTDSLKLTLEASLQIESKSNYITDTSLKESILILPVKKDKLFIDLEYIDEGDKIHCVANPTIEPDFMEMKDTTNDWVKLNNKSFNVTKSGKNQFIQVRGKYKGLYSYSNVIKIYKSINK